MCVWVSLYLSWENNPFYGRDCCACGNKIFFYFFVISNAFTINWIVDLKWNFPILFSIGPDEYNIEIMAQRYYTQESAHRAKILSTIWIFNFYFVGLYNEWLSFWQKHQTIPQATNSIGSGRLVWNMKEIII